MQVHDRSALAFYAQPAVMTSAGCYASLLDPPRDIAGLAAVGHGLLIHEYLAEAYEVMLPWDCWGAMPMPDTLISNDDFALFDCLAALTQTPDSAFAQLRELCQDDRLRVPPVVRNAVRQRDEAIE